MKNLCKRIFSPTSALCALAALLISMATIALPRGAAADTDKRVALVIGNGDYKVAPKLDNPPVDARAVAASLKRLGFQVIEGYDQGIDQMRQSVEDFTTAMGDSKAAILYYAGHGVAVDGENWLLPTDIVLKKPSDLRYHAINLSDLLKEMKREDRPNVVILDACRDNPFKDELAKSRSAFGERGMTRIDDNLARGILIAFATDPGNVAQDGKPGENSPFTKALLRHMEDRGVTIDAVMSDVRQDVAQSTDKKQIPWLNTSLIGKFYLNPEPEVAGAAKQQVASLGNASDAPTPNSMTTPADERLVQENKFWDEAKQSNLPADYQAYLDAYPNGVYAALARNRIAAAKSKAPDTSTGKVALADTKAISVEPASGGASATISAPLSAASPVVSGTPNFKSEIGTMATEQTLNFSEPDRKELQQRLTVLGFNAGSPDGVLAISTRHAIVDWQKKHDLAPTGWLGPLQYAELKTESEVLYEQAMAAQPTVTRHAVVVQEPRRVYVQQQPHYRQDGGAAAGAAMMGAILGGALSGMSHHHSSPFGF